MHSPAPAAAEVEEGAAEITAIGADKNMMSGAEITETTVDGIAAAIEETMGTAWPVGTGHRGIKTSETIEGAGRISCKVGDVAAVNGHCSAVPGSNIYPCGTSTRAHSICLSVPSLCMAVIFV